MMDDTSLAVSIVAAVISAISAAFSFLQARAAGKSYKAQTDPDVIVYMAPSPNQSHSAHVVVKNIGFGPAIDVLLDIDKKIPTSRGVTDFYEKGAFSNPISFLEPGGERRYFVGFFPDVLAMMGETTYEISVSYRNRKRAKYKDKFSIDAGSYGAWVVDEPREVKALNDISKKMSEASREVARSIDGLSEVVASKSAED